MDSTPTRRLLLALAATCITLPALAANHELTVKPISPGKFAVACSNIAQDTSLIAPGASASDYWEGRPGNGQAHYISDILANPGSALQFDVSVPDVRRIYVGHAGDKVRYVALVCYPTSRTNTDADYTLPETGDVVPHMQPAGAAPKFVGATEYALTLGLVSGSQVPELPPLRLPLIVYSHGLGGSPISSGYIDSMVQLAAQGYMVAGIFHGDPRFSVIHIDDLSSLVNVLANFDRITELMFMRPLSLKAMLDQILADPSYAAIVDTSRIGGFGASLGGMAMVGLAGGSFSTNLDGGSCDEPQHDPRIKAVFGYVPYGGQHFAPAFCASQAGAKAVNVPYLAMSGTADTTAPLDVMEQAVNNFSGSHFMVELIGGQHELRPEDAGDLFTWMMTFYDAYLGVQADPNAMARFIKMDQVVGGREDHMIVDVHVPGPPAHGDGRTYEFFNTITGHYFMTVSPDEANGIVAGSAGPGWQLTGQGFKAWPAAPQDPAFAAALPVCRFYSFGANSHFFTVSPAECDIVKKNRDWTSEGIGFWIQPPDAADTCPPGYLAVLRAYNNGAPRNDQNHRFTTSDSTWREMTREGWSPEGTAMCALP